MSKKLSITLVLLAIATAINMPSSAAASMGIASLESGVSEYAGNIFEVGELNRAYTMSLRLDVTKGYEYGTIKVTFPAGIKLEYNAGNANVPDWREIASGEGTILKRETLSAGSNISVPMRITLLRAGDHRVKFEFYNETASDNVINTLSTTWSAPVPKYNITFADMPDYIAGGSEFAFKAYFLRTESGSFDYQKDTMLRLSVDPATSDYRIKVNGGQNVIERGQNSGSITFALPEEGAAKEAEITALFDRNGTYRVIFELIESDGRVISSGSVNVPVGTPIDNPYTGRGASPILYTLPILPLVMFYYLLKLKEN